MKTTASFLLAAIISCGATATAFAGAPVNQSDLTATKQTASAKAAQAKPVAAAPTSAKTESAQVAQAATHKFHVKLVAKGPPKNQVSSLVYVDEKGVETPAARFGQ